MSINLSINANGEGFPATQFLDFCYLDVTSFNGKLIMCDANGLFEHSGSDDNGVAIDAWFEVATTDFDILNQKRLRAVIGSGLFTGNIVLGVSFDDGSYTDYPIVTNQVLDQTAWKRFVNREQVGAHVRVKVSNVDGSDFSVDTLTAIAVILHNLPMDRAIELPRSRITIATTVATLTAAVEIV